VFGIPWAVYPPVPDSNINILYTAYDFIYKPAPILDHTMLHLVGIFGWRSGKCWKTTSIDIEEGKGDWVVGLPMFYYSIKEDAK